MVDNSLSMMEHIYENEKKLANHVFFTQPYGNGEVKDTTYGEAVAEARKMAAYLQSLGFEKGDKIGMISKNCDKFIIAEMAIWMAGYTTVAIFPNTNAKTVGYCLENSDAKFLFVGKLDDYETLDGGFPEGIPKISFPLAPEKARDSFDHWEDIIAATEPLQGEPGRDDGDMALFIYTSGSTGQPKGVMHTFKSMTTAAHGILGTYPKLLNKNTRLLSYLPLAHVFERAYISSTSLITGSHIFFAESIATFKDDLQRARPTVFISVPRLWSKFQDGVFKKLPEKKLNRLMRLPIVGRFIKKKILKGLGLDAVKLAGSGSAPIPAELLEWYRRLGLNLYEGYAMSEDFAYSHLSKPGLSKVGYVGVPYDGVEVRIGEGDEILIKSPGAMAGYYKLPEKTKESFTEDGFFKTGDRGERLENGLLKITGRLKEIFKTSKGKYVSPAPIENIINANSVVETSLVGGDGQPQPYAQVIIAESLRPKMGEEATKKMITEELTTLLKEVNDQVEHHEQLNFFVVVKDLWTTENGCLTPTLKIQRGKIEGNAAPKVQGWYDMKEKVIFE